jgi:hypothetical protein
MCPGRLLVDAGQLLGATVNDLVPPDAQVHLLNAQRELLLALKVTLDHHRRHAESADRGERRRPVRVEID